MSGTQLEVTQAQNDGLKSCLQTWTASAGYLGCDLTPVIRYSWQ